MVKPSKPLAEYRRVSRKGEREDDRFRSPDFQREAIAGFAKAERLALVQFPAEIDVAARR